MNCRSQRGNEGSRIYRQLISIQAPHVPLSPWRHNKSEHVSFKDFYEIPYECQEIQGYEILTLNRLSTVGNNTLFSRRHLIFGLRKICDVCLHVNRTAFWYATPCSLVDGYQHFWRTCSLHLHSRLNLKVLYLENGGNSYLQTLQPFGNKRCT